MIKPLYKKIAIFFLFFLISIFVLSELIFNAKIFGRYLDFSLPPVSYLLRNAFSTSLYTWSYPLNGGTPNSFGTTLLPVNLILYLPLIFKNSVWFLSRYQIVLTVFLGLSFFYLLSQRLLVKIQISASQKAFLAVLASLFFVFNNYIFVELIFGSNVMSMTFVFVPLLLYSIISYFETSRNKKFYFLLALCSLLVVSSTMQHLVLAYLFMIVLAIIYKDKKFFFRLILTHVLLSLYWILPLLGTISSVNSVELAKDYSLGILVSSSKFLSTLINSDYFGNRNIYRLSLGSNFLAKVWTINAFLLLIIALNSVYSVISFKKIQRKIILGSFFIFLLSLLFIKGARDPFGSLVLFLYNNFSLLKLFRSPQHFLSFYVISISILFLYSSVNLLKKSKLSIWLLFVFIIINAMPWWLTRDLGKRTLAQNTSLPTINQFDLSGGDEMMYALNKLPLDFSVLTVPPGASINFFTPGSDQVSSQGGDAGLVLGNKRFYASEQSMVGFKNVLDDLEQEMYSGDDFFNKNKNLFAYLNIKYIIIRKDTSPNFSKNMDHFNFNSIEKSMKKATDFKEIYRDDNDIILENENFLPHFYNPCAVTQIQSSNLTLDALTSGNDKICNAVYPDNQSSNASLPLLIQANKNGGNPTFEFKKINSTKYRLVIHNATGSLPIVFSEMFNPNWKTYIVDNQQSVTNSSDKNKLIDKINDNFNGYSTGQASKEELINYINDGIISNFAQVNSVNFVSKNFAGTIQNDNLSTGSFFETWFNTPIDEKNHSKVNGYANSWTIDPTEVCRGNDNCTRNADGSYNIELVVEFWPQRLFFLGLIVVYCVLLGSIIYFIFSEFKYKRL